jgi:hypothetical protein
MQFLGLKCKKFIFLIRLTNTYIIINPLKKNNINVSNYNVNLKIENMFLPTQLLSKEKESPDGNRRRSKEKESRSA